MIASDTPSPPRPLVRPWMTTPQTRAVIDALERAGGVGCARFVGGCVRDALLDRDQGDLDIDIATPLTPPEVTFALKAARLRAIPTGVEHGTVTALAPDAQSRGRPFEITTLRRDVETDGRRAVVAFATDWAEDAARRDFRLNALYLAPDGALHDPTGGGIADALAGRIVFVGDPSTRIREDYLRVLRFFRFLAGYGRGEPDPAAVVACTTLRAGVADLSGERVSKELLKLLSALDPGPAMRLMRDTGVLAVLLPAVTTVDRLCGVIRVERIEGVEPDAGLRLAALLPDDRAVVAEAGRRLRLTNAMRDRLLDACSNGTLVDAGLAPPAIRLAIYRLGAQAVADRLRLGWATAPDRDAPSRRALLSITRDWSPPPFPISGAEVKAAGVPQGPLVGQVRREVEAWWIARDFADDPPGADQALSQAVSRLPPQG